MDQEMGLEIEIGVLSQQCLNRRIPDRETLRTEVAAWQAQRNAQNARIRWMFGVEDARRKLGKAYPEPTTCDALADAA